MPITSCRRLVTAAGPRSSTSSDREPARPWRVRVPASRRFGHRGLAGLAAYAAPPWQALDGLRVLELGGEIAAPYATKLLCELGADVCKVEPPDGDPLRTWRPVASMPRPDPDRGGGLFRYLNGGKRSAVVDLETPDGARWLLDAAVGADLIIESLGAGALEAIGLAPGVLHAANPRVALVRISDYGQAGPLRRYRRRAGSWSRPTAAGCRATASRTSRRSRSARGSTSTPPGTFAAAAALTAWRAARAGAPDVVVDLSVMECLVGTLAYPNLVLEDTLSAGMPPPTARWFPLPGIRRCRDGWVGINALTGQHFLDACVMLGVEELGPRPAGDRGRRPALDEFFARVQPWLDARDAQDVVELSQAFRVPAAPVGDGRMMLELRAVRGTPVLRRRRTASRCRGRPTGSARHRRSGAARRRPAARSAPVRLRSRQPPDVGATRPDAPFAGLRVVDLGTLLGRPLLHDVPRRVGCRRHQGRVDASARRLPVLGRVPADGRRLVRPRRDLRRRPTSTSAR